MRPTATAVVIWKFFQIQHSKVIMCGCVSRPVQPELHSPPGLVFSHQCHWRNVEMQAVAHVRPKVCHQMLLPSASWNPGTKPAIILQMANLHWLCSAQPLSLWPSRPCDRHSHTLLTLLTLLTLTPSSYHQIWSLSLGRGPWNNNLHSVCLSFASLTDSWAAHIWSLLQPLEINSSSRFHSLKPVFLLLCPANTQLFLFSFFFFHLVKFPASSNRANRVMAIKGCRRSNSDNVGMPGLACQHDISDLLIWLGERDAIVR